MDNKSNRIDGVEVTVTKAAEPAVSQKGVTYLKLNARADVGDGEWVTLMAFGLLAKNLAGKLNKKGARAKVYGTLKTKEYQKKDGSGVGVENTIMLSKAMVVNGDKLETISEFSTNDAPF